MLVKKQKIKPQSRVLFIDEIPIFAKELLRFIHQGDCIALTGEIGSGKTTFVHAYLRELGLPDHIPFSSPTFNIFNHYFVNGSCIHHIDLYRLDHFQDLEKLNILEEIGRTPGLTFIEWGTKFSELLPYYNKKIHFEYIKGKALDRLVHFEGFETLYG